MRHVVDSAMDQIHLEDFWGVELSAKKKKYVWKDEDSDDEDTANRTLELRQACLGAKAREGDRNVVQLTTENEEGDQVSHTILSMGVGKLEQSQLLLTLRSPVTLELISGQGPVHIVGSVQDTFSAFGSEDDSDDDEESEESEQGEDEQEHNAARATGAMKRPASEPLGSAKPNKMLKIQSKPQNEETDSNDDDEDDGEESGSDESMEDSARPPLASRQAEEGEDDEEDDSEEELDEDDSEDEESEEEESESEEEQQPPPPPKKLSNGKKSVKAAVAQFKTPQPKKPQVKALAAKGSRSAPTTPKDKSTAVAKVALTTNEIKAKLAKQHPNLPKKLEKFNNFVANSFKVKDDNTKKELWQFVQKLGKREQ